MEKPVLEPNGGIICLTEREDARAQILSRLEKLRTLDRLAEEMPGSRKGNGWDPSKIPETTLRVVSQPLEKLVRKAIRRGIFQRVADYFRPLSALPRLAGTLTVVYFPLWHVKGYHECFYLRKGDYNIRVDKDVVAVEIDGETRDLMIEEEDTMMVTETLRRSLKRFSRLFTGERKYFNLNDVTELAVKQRRAEMYLTSDGREGDVLDEILPGKWRTQRIFDLADLNVEGTTTRIAISKETKETALQKFQERLVKMPETYKQILINTFQIEELVQFYVPFLHFPIIRGERLEHVMLNGASTETADAKTAASMRSQLGI